MQHTTHSDFAESLSHLREALVDADPLTLGPAGSVDTQAEHVEGLFSGAKNDEDRSRLLLRALDDAIASLEIAARLTDELHARRHDLGVESDASEQMDDERTRLRGAYLAFMESQTQYQALYQYRNILAAQLREQSRVVPERVAPPTPSATDEPLSEQPASAEKPRRRAKKA